MLNLDWDIYQTELKKKKGYLESIASASYADIPNVNIFHFV